MAFVTQFFNSSSVYHVGYRQVSAKFGVLHSDYSHGLGLPFYTWDATGKLLVNTSLGLINSSQCVTFDSTNYKATAALVSPCPTARGVCKAKLGKY